MEAANRGAADAGGRTIGLNIGLPHEQRPNPYITPELGFEFHYFFMRKLWFAHLARAHRRLPRRLRHARRAVRDPDALRRPRKLERPIPIAALRLELLAGDRQLRGARAPRDDRRGGPRAARSSSTPRPKRSRGSAAALGSESATTAPSFARSRTCDEPRRGLLMAARGIRARAAAARRAAGDGRARARARLPARGPGRGRRPVRRRRPARRRRARPARAPLVLDRQRRLARPGPAHGGGRPARRTCTTIRVAVADVSATVARGSALDRHAAHQHHVGLHAAAELPDAARPAEHRPDVAQRRRGSARDGGGDRGRRRRRVRRVEGLPRASCATTRSSPTMRSARGCRATGRLPAALAAVPGLADNLKLQDRRRADA